MNAIKKKSKKKVCKKQIARAHKLLREKNDIAGALKIAQDLQKEAPENPYIYGLFVECYIRSNELNKAEQFARNGISQEATPINRYLLARTLVLRHNSEEGNNRLEEAISHLQNNITSGNATRDDYLLLAKIEYLKGDYEEALDMTEQARMQNPSRDFLARNQQAEILLAQGDFEKARDVFEDLDEKTEKNYLLQLARVAIARNELDEAEITIQRAHAVACQKKNVEDIDYALSLWAEILRKQKRYSSAVKKLEGIKRMRPGAYLCKAYCYMHLKQFDQSLYSLHKAEKLLSEQKATFLGFDPRVRLHAGYIFLYDTVPQEIRYVFTSLRKKAETAYEWLRNFPRGRLGSLQVNDFESALSIGKKKHAGFRKNESKHHWLFGHVYPDFTTEILYSQKSPRNAIHVLEINPIACCEDEAQKKRAPQLLHIMQATKRALEKNAYLQILNALFKAGLDYQNKVLVHIPQAPLFAVFDETKRVSILGLEAFDNVRQRCKDFYPIRIEKMDDVQRELLQALLHLDQASPANDIMKIFSAFFQTGIQAAIMLNKIPAGVAG